MRHLLRKSEYDQRTALNSDVICFMLIVIVYCTVITRSSFSLHYGTGIA